MPTSLKQLILRLEEKCNEIEREIKEFSFDTNNTILFLEQERKKAALMAYKEAIIQALMLTSEEYAELSNTWEKAIEAYENSGYEKNVSVAEFNNYYHNVLKA